MAALPQLAESVVEKVAAFSPSSGNIGHGYETRPFYSIAELAERWRCSRASVYNHLRGHKVIDFASGGKKGHKIVPLEVVLKIERARLKVLR